MSNVSSLDPRWVERSVTYNKLGRIASPPELVEIRG
jgi:hypothetical protein